jgi:hypothetical protein
MFTLQNEFAANNHILLNPSSGNVGIGLVVPSQKLEVAGNIMANGGSLFGNGANIVNGQGSSILWNANTVVGGVANQGMTTLVNHVGSGPGGFTFSSTNNNVTYTEKMRIDPAGNLGVGTSAPTAKLSVNGAANNTTGVW